MRAEGERERERERASKGFYNSYGSFLCIICLGLMCRVLVSTIISHIFHLTHHMFFFLISSIFCHKYNWNLEAAEATEH
jgi:hypothetical protein